MHARIGFDRIVKMLEQVVLFHAEGVLDHDLKSSRNLVVLKDLRMIFKIFVIKLLQDLKALTFFV